MWVFTELFAQIKAFIWESFEKREVWALLFLFGFLGMVFAIFDIRIDIVGLLLALVSLLWPFVLLIPMLKWLTSVWIYWRQQLFQGRIKWLMLEVKIPREIKKSPAAMEQVIRAIHSQRNAPGDFQERYMDGEVTMWYSLEIVSFGGDIHFFIRTYWKHKPIIQAAFFSYYPDVEIEEVEDYVEKLPKDLGEMYERGYDLWGTELVLVKEDAYPIKSYEQFEDMAEERQLDPISNFLEILGNIKPEEIVGIQIQISAKDAKWAEKWEELLSKLKETKTTTAPEDPTRTIPILRTPGETAKIEAIEKNLSKPAFDTLIRFMYVAPKSVFYETFARRGIVGAFNQYATIDLNMFRQNYPMSTRTRIWDKPHLFVSTRGEYRKQRIIYNYRNREMPPETWWGKFISSYFFNLNFASKTFDMNVESIATLFHPPTSVVLTAPHITRVESRKGTPPAGMAVFGEESDIEKFIGKPE